MRLYEPLSGNILDNGKQYQDYKVSDYRSLFFTVFQDFTIYNVSVAENVLMDLVKTDEDEKRVIDALKKVGLYDKVKNTKDGIYTLISKEFSDSGLVLSGGEKQKLAIARALCSSAEIFVFDEASSALDPISEHDINSLILSLAKDKTVILISHRLSTTRDVDVIYLLEDGKVKEQGSHEQLMQLNGEYARMFTIQSRQYLRNMTDTCREDY